MAGMISVGKTTYTKRLAEELGTVPFYEPVEDNPILEKYYEDPEKYGFALQIYFLNKRFDLIKEAYRHDNNVLDRSIFEDKLFTYINVLDGNISELEYDIYLDLMDNMMEELEGMPKKAPDLLVYLEADYEHIIGNIRKRGRDYEQIEGEPEREDYYKSLHSNYRGWYEDYDVSPKMSIDASKYDVNDDDDWEKVNKLIKDKLKEVRGS